MPAIVAALQLSLLEKRSDDGGARNLSKDLERCLLTWGSVRAGELVLYSISKLER